MYEIALFLLINGSRIIAPRVILSDSLCSLKFCYKLHYNSVSRRISQCSVGSSTVWEKEVLKKCLKSEEKKMKLIIFLVVLCVFHEICARPEIPWTGGHLDDKYGHHFDQHRESIQTARKGAVDRFSEMGVTGSYVQDIGSGSSFSRSSNFGSSSSNFGSSSSSSFGSSGSSGGFSSLGDAELVGGYTGVGVVSYPSLSSGGSSSKFSSSSMQESRSAAAPVHVYSPSSSSSSSYSASSQSERVQQAQPVVVPVSGGSERYSSHSERVSETKAVPQPVILPVSGGSERYSSHSERVSEVKAVPQPVILPVSGGSERYSSRSERISEVSAPQPVILPVSGGSERYSSRSERIQEVKSVPQPVILPSSGSERYSSHSERIQEVKSVPQPIILPSSSGSERYSSHSERVSRVQAQPVVTVYPQGGSERYSSHQERFSQQAAAPVPIVYPSGGSSRFSSHSERVSSSNLAAAPVVPILPSSSSRYSAHSESLRHGTSHPTFYPVYQPSGGSSSFSRSENFQRTGNSYVPVPVIPETSSKFVSEQSSSSSSGSTGGGFVYPTYPYYSLDSNRASSRFGGSSVFDSHSNLGSYMSESERLARLQASSVGGGAAMSGSSTFESDAYNDNLLGGSTASLGGAGSTRSKSWESSSKWQSGTQYDASGKPKTYGLLSTAESEHHNVDGKSTGFKAATTTVEDDGKVSTYSIHTP